MKNYIMVGCDLHDASMVLRIAHNEGKVQTRTCSNDGEGRALVVTELWRQAQAAGGAQIVWAYEASAQGYGLHDELTEAGIACHILAPTKMERSVRRRKSKCDQKDAQAILEVLRGHLLGGNELPAVWIPDPALRDEREAVRARLDAAEKAVSVRTQVKMLLKRHGVRKPSDVGLKWTRKYKAWLLGLVNADTVMAVGARAALGSLLRQLQALEAEVAALDLTLSALAASERYRAALQELLTLKGVGVLTALVFLTEMGDLTRFGNRRQIGAYLGLVPSQDESGEANDRKGHITRQGNSRVRKLLCQAVWSRVRTDPAEREWYQGVVARNPKHKKIAVVGAMRRLGVLMWHVAQRPTANGQVNGASLGHGHSPPNKDKKDSERALCRDHTPACPRPPGSRPAPRLNLV